MKKSLEEAKKVKRCITGKKQSTYRQARKDVRFLRYYKKYPGEVPQAYKCKVCKYWHVGNSA